MFRNKKKEVEHLAILKLRKLTKLSIFQPSLLILVMTTVSRSVWTNQEERGKHVTHTAGARRKEKVRFGHLKCG